MTESKKHEFYIGAVEASMKSLIALSNTLEKLVEETKESDKYKLQNHPEMIEWANEASERISAATDKISGGNPMPDEVRGDPQHMQFTCLGVVLDFMSHYCDHSVMNQAVSTFLPEFAPKADIAKGIQQIVSKIAEQAGLSADVRVVPVEIDPEKGTFRRLDGEKFDEDDPFENIPEIGDGDTVVVDSRKVSKDER